MEEKEQSIDGDWEDWNFRQRHTTITLTSGKSYSLSLNSSTIKHLLRASSMLGSRISCLGPSIRSFAIKVVWQASRRDLWKRTPGARRRKAWLSLLGPWKWLHFPTHRRPQGLEPDYWGFTLAQLTRARQSICASISSPLKWEKYSYLSYSVLRGSH